MKQIQHRSFDGLQVRSEEGTRKMTFIASDGSRDAHGTVLNPDGWNLDRFNRNGIIGYQHKVYGSWDATDNPDNVIGKGRAYVEDKKLMVEVEFEPAEINELAEKIYRKLQFGSLKAVSVGFVPIGEGHFGEGDEAFRKENETYYFEGQELLEVSIVNIPSNPNAVKKAIEDDEFMNAVRAEEEKKTAPAPEPEEVRDMTLEAMQRITIAQAELTLRG